MERSPSRAHLQQETSMHLPSVPLAAGIVLQLGDQGWFLLEAAVVGMLAESVFLPREAQETTQQYYGTLPRSGRGG